ncbi:hypothetical protein MMC09_003065 [Bachmanniomyces sp. S44760]|nr:hypothetical protein [Bachmanniomyces sp. S44760]
MATPHDPMAQIPNKVRVHNNLLEQFDSRKNIWRRAIYHTTIRAELIRRASQNGTLTYVHERARGPQQDDVTSFLQSQGTWGGDRAHRPPQLFAINPPAPPARRTLAQIQEWFWTHNEIIIDFEGNPLRIFAELPDTISSLVEDWLVEAIRRLDGRISMRDFRSRMLQYYSDPPPVKQIGTTAIANRAERFRRACALISWHNREGSKEVRDAILNKIPASCKQANSVRNFRDLNATEQKEIQELTKNQGGKKGKKGRKKDDKSEDDDGKGKGKGKGSKKRKLKGKKPMPPAKKRKRTAKGSTEEESSSESSDESSEEDSPQPKPKRRQIRRARKPKAAQKSRKETSDEEEDEDGSPSNDEEAQPKPRPGRASRAAGRKRKASEDAEDEDEDEDDPIAGPSSTKPKKRIKFSPVASPPRRRSVASRKRKASEDAEDEDEDDDDDNPIAGPSSAAIPKKRVKHTPAASPPRRSGRIRAATQVQDPAPTAPATRVSPEYHSFDPPLLGVPSSSRPTTNLLPTSASATTSQPTYGSYTDPSQGIDPRLTTYDNYANYEFDDDHGSGQPTTAPPLIPSFLGTLGNTAIGTTAVNPIVSPYPPAGVQSLPTAVAADTAADADPVADPEEGLTAQGTLDPALQEITNNVIDAYTASEEARRAADVEAEVNLDLHAPTAFFNEEARRSYPQGLPPALFGENMLGRSHQAWNTAIVPSNNLRWPQFPPSLHRSERLGSGGMAGPSGTVAGGEGGLPAAGQLESEFAGSGLTNIAYTQQVDRPTMSGSTESTDGEQVGNYALSDSTDEAIADLMLRGRLSDSVLTQASKDPLQEEDIDMEALGEVFEEHAQEQAAKQGGDNTGKGKGRERTPGAE